MKVALLRLHAMNKSSLIYESGAETQINIHPARENLTTHHMHHL
jgi:hypothetical protein